MESVSIDKNAKDLMAHQKMNEMSEKNKTKTQILPTLAFGLLKDVEAAYKLEKKFSVDNLQALHAIFGSVLVRAMELLENGRVIQYQTKSLRKILKVENRNEYYTLFTNINFCHCPAFKYQVLCTKNALTCKHVLAAKLAEISNQIKVETMEDRCLVDLLNSRLEEEDET